MLIYERACIINFVMDNKIQVLLARMLRDIREAEFLVCTHDCGCIDSSRSSIDVEVASFIY